MADRQTIIELTYAEMQIACMIAAQRQIQNIKYNAQPTYGSSNSDESTWSRHIIGCLGEMAVAKYLNRYWCGAIGNYESADVDKYQVRATPRQNGRLILHPDDPQGLFILVRVSEKICNLVGWIHADDGRRDEFWQDVGNSRPAYFVPQGALKNMEDFPCRN